MTGSNRPENKYRVRLSWKPEKGSVSRKHVLHIGSGAEVQLSPSSERTEEEFFSSPEEIFLGAISSCLMLTFLNLCKKNSIQVLGYQDDATSILARGPDGRFSVEKIHLRPRVTFGEPELEDWKAFAVRLFHEAHYYCFLINSVKSVVDVEPLFVVE